MSDKETAAGLNEDPTLESARKVEALILFGGDDELVCVDDTCGPAGTSE